MAHFTASQGPIGKDLNLCEWYSYLPLSKLVSGARGIIKSLEDEQAQLADGIEVN